MWNKLLKLRDCARTFIRCRIGSGSNCSFWHDNWTGLGSLSQLLGRSAIRATGIRYEATVQEAICLGQWRISSRSRNPIITFLRGILPDPNILIRPSLQDVFHWVSPGDDPSPQTPSRFSASRTFTTLFPPPPEVPWYRSVWFSGRIPKHAFTTWLAAHDRLPTKDRIRRFSPIISPTCFLCASHAESRDHLFFLCPYSLTLIQSVLHMMPTYRTLLPLLQWLPRSSPDRHMKLIGHLILQATVYSLWRERNSRLHTTTSRPAEQLARDIMITIKAKLISLRKVDNGDSPSLLESWFGLQSQDPLFRFTP